MFKDKFDIILDKDEEIKWCDKVNASSYVKKSAIKMFLFGLFPPFAILMLGIPYSWLLLTLSLLEVIPLYIGIVHFAFSILAVLAYITVLTLDAKNTYCCITNKRIIKRSGAFNNDFSHYSLKNIGTIKVDGSIFDKKDTSATLLVKVKDYHNNAQTNSEVLVVDSLNNAYEAYKILNELTEGNNENLRVKLEE